MAGAEYTQIMNLTPQEIFEVVVDYDRYADFLPMIKESKIIKRESDTIVLCRFVASMIKEFEYTLRLEQTPYEKTRWTYVEGSFKDNTGGWDFVPINANQVKVTYRVEIDFGFLVPKIVANQIVGSSLPSMLRTMEKRALQLRSAP